MPKHKGLLGGFSDCQGGEFHPGWLLRGKGCGQGTDGPWGRFYWNILGEFCLKNQFTISIILHQLKHPLKQICKFLYHHSILLFICFVPFYFFVSILIWEKKLICSTINLMFWETLQIPWQLTPWHYILPESFKAIPPSNCECNLGNRLFVEDVIISFVLDYLSNGFTEVLC